LHQLSYGSSVAEVLVTEIQLAAMPMASRQGMKHAALLLSHFTELESIELESMLKSKTFQQAILEKHLPQLTQS
jgi:hypothetical protein